MGHNVLRPPQADRVIDLPFAELMASGAPEVLIQDSLQAHSRPPEADGEKG